MTLEQTLETVAKIQKAWDALALSISDAAEAFAKMWEEVFSSPDIWPGRKSVPPRWSKAATITVSSRSFCWPLLVCKTGHLPTLGSDFAKIWRLDSRVRTENW